MGPGLYVIAEAGVNHNGSLTLAKKLVDAALAAGADAVKFQSFSAKRLVRPSTELVPYQIGSAADHFKLLEGLELSRSDQAAISQYCSELGITFLSTPYSADDARFLIELGVEVIKIASADIVDLEMHTLLCEQGVKVLASTGMATMFEVERLANFYGFHRKLDNLWLLQCVSNYPSKVENQNLEVLRAYKQLVGDRLGFSDHTSSSIAALVAVGAGATVFEKHLTLDRQSTGPDHFASLEPTQFAAYVADLRLAQQSLGSRVKEPQEEELEMRRTSRKGVYYRRDLNVGDQVTWSDVELMRPANGTDAWETLAALPFLCKTNQEHGQAVIPSGHDISK